MAGGGTRQRPNAIGMVPISCLMSPSAALTSKSGRIFAVVKFEIQLNIPDVKILNIETTKIKVADPL